MIRTTTPTHTFTLPIDPVTIDELWVTYTQGGSIKLEKQLSDLAIDSDAKSVSFTLTQEETKAFTEGSPVYFQLKCRQGETVMASPIYTVMVGDVLNDDLMGVPDET